MSLNQPRTNAGQYAPFPAEGTTAESEEAMRQAKQKALDGMKAHDEKTKAWHKRNMDRAFGNPTVQGD